MSNYHFMTKLPAFTAVVIKEKMEAGITPTAREIRELAKVEANFDKHKKHFIQLANLYVDTIYDDWELHTAAKIYYPTLPEYPGLKRKYLLDLLSNIDDEKKFYAGLYLLKNWADKYKGLTFIVKNPTEEAEIVGFVGVEIIDPRLTARMRIALTGKSMLEKGRVAKEFVQFLHNIYLKQLYEQKYKYVTFQQMGETHTAVIKRFNDLEESEKAHFKLVGTPERKRFNGRPTVQKWYQLNLYKKFPLVKNATIEEENKIKGEALTEKLIFEA